MQRHRKLIADLYTSHGINPRHDVPATKLHKHTTHVSQTLVEVESVIQRPVDDADDTDLLKRSDLNDDVPEDEGGRLIVAPAPGVAEVSATPGAKKLKKKVSARDVKG